MRTLGRLAAPLVVGVLVGAWVAAWRWYGIYDLADEGLLLVQAARTLAGQTPYEDFHTGYGALYFRLQARLLDAGGLGAVRGALAVVHGLTAALAFVLGRRLLGVAGAIAVVVVQVAFFLPVAPSQGAPFNVPYPGWYAGLAGAAVAVVVTGGPRVPWRLALAGAVAGATFAMKPNSGLLLAAGAVMAVLVTAPRRGHDGRVPMLAGGALVAAAALLILPAGPTVAGLVLLPPVVVLGWLGGRGPIANGQAAGPLALVGAGFLAVAGVAVGPTWAALGAERFAREVLLLGSGVAELFAVPFLLPVGVGALGGALLYAGRPLAGAVGVAIGVVGAAAIAASSAPGPLSAIRQGAEQALLALVPVTLWGGLRWARADRSDLGAGLVAVAVPASLQLYPRADFEHLMPLAPLLVPIGLRLWRDAVGGRPATTALAVGLPLVLAMARIAPSVAPLAAVVRGRAPVVEIGATRLVIAEAGAARLAALAATVETVRLGSVPDARILAFPACAIVTFFADRLPAGPHDYFWPGRPARAEVEQLVRTLRRAPPPLAITCRLDGALEAAWQRHPAMVELLVTRYAEWRSHPPFAVRILAP